MEGCEAVLSSGLGSALFSKTIAEFVTRISSIGNVQKRLSKVEEFVGCLEEEMQKIHAFKRELPLCMFLLSDAIAYLKEVSKRWCKRSIGEVEKPVLQEIDLMKEVEEEKVLEVVRDYSDKKSWSSSFQLWNSDLNPSKESTVHKLETKESKIALGLKALKSKAENGLLKAFEKEEEEEIPIPELSLEPPVASTLVGKLGASDMRSSMVRGSAPSGSHRVRLDSRNGMSLPLHHHHQQQLFRKQRRCWSPELHKAFVSALQELGGPQVATPKQIRDLMRVEGLTNDEVKSHLQKYRLHIRRVPNKQTDTFTSQSYAVLGLPENNQDNSGESSKQSNATESGSPPGPLDLHPRHENDSCDD